MRAVPIGVGVIVWGLTFGLMAREAGLSLLESSLMSTLVYSGTAQAATVGGLGAGVQAGAGILAGVATVLMLNARYLLYGASLRPWLGHATPAQAYATLYFLGDANWAMSTKAHADGENDAAFILGSGVSMFLPWVGGTVLGALAGNWIADPRMLGVDFLLVAFCAAMAMDLFKSRSDIAPAIAAVTVAALLDHFTPSGWTLVAAGVAGGLTAWLRYEEPA
ncbi:MAG: AzlC family ABC transporter permease [Betaproteobacteria bacterium]